jgi:hypothetical protein
MTTANDPAEALRALGFRTSADALRALLAHATKSKMSPAELCLDLAALEKRERDDRNLAARTKSATLGPVKSFWRSGIGPARRCRRTSRQRPSSG